MKKKINFLSIIIIIGTIGLLLIIGYVRNNPVEAKDVYLVYLNEKKIGIISDKDDLYKKIDDTQNQIKKEYKVDKVYPPSTLKVIPYKTYRNKINTVSEIYTKIQENSDFTIKGYTVKIKKEKEEPKYINILYKEDLEPALKEAVSAFIPADKIDNYMKGTQEEIGDIGKYIDNLHFNEKITIKENYLPTSSNIIKNKNDLTKYLLFGTLKEQEEYIVKDGDTVEKVAYDNRLSNEELLIANPKLSSINSLLSAGQKLNIGLINPLFTVVEEAKVIEDVESVFKTVYEQDPNKYPSQSYVKQEGKNGINRVTELVVSNNGQIMKLKVNHSSEISSPIDKIVVKGTKKSPEYGFNYYPPAASSTDWGWPTSSPYVITSYFGYRWGKLHGGIDISGTPYPAPIYSSTEGIVTKVNSSCPNRGYYGSRCGNQFGNYVEIKSSTGMEIYYAHLKNNIKVSVGQTVQKGQLIGYMGTSGSSTGTHLHFEIRDSAGRRINPCRGPFRC